ncbi:uncharacterized protein LOC124276096 [Haliotis rubra]|uniref:uncharacterized protein LOC124276096 n=1 Tax=Haliotis rubra TaxID=36100 RepID=UPI001EE5B9A0|nr:uncharacterized protein LOC124276096 [Haliotis rubra]
MELSTLVFLILVLTAVSDLRAVRKRGTLSDRVREMEMDINAWKAGHVLEEVQSLKTKVQNTKIEIKALAQRLRSVEQERDTYRKSLGKLRGRLTEDIRVLQLQVNQTVADLRDARTTTYPGTTAASTGLTQHNTVPPPPVTTQDSDLQATPSPAAGRRLYSASEDGDLETVKRILAAGQVDINTRGGYWSKTPVMAAALGGHRDVVEFLVGRGG